MVFGFVQKVHNVGHASEEDVRSYCTERGLSVMNTVQSISVVAERCLLPSVVVL